MITNMRPEDRSVYIRNDLAKRLYEAQLEGMAGIGYYDLVSWAQMPDEVKSVYQHAALVVFEAVERRVADEEVKALLASHEELLKLVKERDWHVGRQLGSETGGGTREGGN